MPDWVVYVVYAWCALLVLSSTARLGLAFQKRKAQRRSRHTYSIRIMGGDPQSHELTEEIERMQARAFRSLGLAAEHLGRATQGSSASFVALGESMEQLMRRSELGITPLPRASRNLLDRGYPPPPSGDDGLTQADHIAEALDKALKRTDNDEEKGNIECRSVRGLPLQIRRRSTKTPPSVLRSKSASRNLNNNAKT